MTTLLPGVFYGNPNNGVVSNSSVAAQTPAAATKTYVSGTALQLGDNQKLRVGARLRFKFNMTKTAAGTATSTIEVLVGSLGTVADAIALAFTKPAGTAAVDEGQVTIDVVVRSVNEAAGTAILVGELVLTHNLAATGHAQIPTVVVNAVSSAVTIDFAQVVGVAITSGASDAITIQMAQAEVAGV